jgi:hypothetical protein
MEQRPSDEEFIKLSQVDRARTFMKFLPSYTEELYTQPNLIKGEYSYLTIPSFSELVDDVILCPYCGKKLSFILTDEERKRWQGTCNCESFKKEKAIIDKYISMRADCLSQLESLTEKVRDVGNLAQRLVKPEFLILQETVMASYMDTVNDYKKLFSEENR